MVLFEDNNIILLLTDFDINSANQKGENEGGTFKIRQGTLKRPLAGRASAAQTILQLMTSLLMPQYWSDKISRNRAKKLCEGE